jgi:hypothetical protein
MPQTPRKLGRHWFLLVPSLLMVSAVLLGYGGRLTGLADAALAHKIDPSLENISVEDGVFRCNVSGPFNTLLTFERYRVRRVSGVVLIEVYSTLIHPPPNDLSKVDQIVFKLEPEDQSVMVTDGNTRRLVWSR